MGSQTLSEALQRGHRAVDEQIEAFTDGLAKGESGTEVLTAGMDALRRHIYQEEEIVFPPLAGTRLEMALFVMRREHGLLWRTMEDLYEAIADDSEPASLAADCRDLTLQLQAHNPKEESTVYAGADDFFSDTQRDELLARLDAAELPDGWVCKKAR